MDFKESLKFNARFWEDRKDDFPKDGQMCDWPGCEELAEYKAPKSRLALKEYHHYCLEHIREYNKSWNYYEGMSSSQIEQDMYKDYTWDRPSWNFGTFKKGPGARGAGFKDDFGFFNQDGSFKREPDDDGPNLSEYEAEERAAFAVMDLKPDVTFAELRARYKVLVKKYHPDANNGDKESEERFKIISQAYTLLKNLLSDD